MTLLMIPFMIPLASHSATATAGDDDGGGQGYHSRVPAITG